MLGGIYPNAKNWTDHYPWGASENNRKRIWGCYLPLVSNTYQDGLFGNIQSVSENIQVKKENNTLFWYSNENYTGQFNMPSYTYYYLYFK